jgi:flagellar biosynthesis protein FliP
MSRFEIARFVGYGLPSRLPLLFFGGLILALLCGVTWAAPVADSFGIPGIQVQVGSAGAANEVATALKIIIGLTVLSLAPAILMSMTSFIRIVIVLSMLRTALGMQDTPPNTVIISLALFLTFFTMSATLQEVNSQAVQPFLSGQLSMEQAGTKGIEPLREFMVRQTREKDLALMVELSKSEAPQTIQDIKLVQLIPAFMLSELRSAFQIGFVIFLPFLLIDLIVSSALMALGMMMVPPTSISLPIKILMFVLIDGWNLVVRALLGTFS